MKWSDLVTKSLPSSSPDKASNAEATRSRSRMRRLVSTLPLRRPRHSIAAPDPESHARLSTLVQALPTEIWQQILEDVLTPWTPNPLSGIKPPPKGKKIRVPKHFGPGQAIYIGNPRHNIRNMSLFDYNTRHDLKFVGTTRKPGVNVGRFRYYMYLHYVVNKNKKKLTCCLHQLLEKPEVSTWKGAGPCEECKKKGRMCILLIDSKTVYYKGRIAGD